MCPLRLHEGLFLSRDIQRSACFALQSLRFRNALLNECKLLIHEMSGMLFLENAREQDGEEAHKKVRNGSPESTGRKTCSTAG